ncbi:hypothetical protein KYB31_09245 [Clostridium felsineum]|uniref:hypothetical protein n=1 Tax=Clostridium felsineum TaxID=36839 RepID=UPI00214DB5D8|nr:hypothetical protein [Clostridium felsineum]MCR3759174.1 hypothetical protein [Clostridium felsineum]
MNENQLNIKPCDECIHKKMCIRNFKIAQNITELGIRESTFSFTCEDFGLYSLHKMMEESEWKKAKCFTYGDLFNKFNEQYGETYDIDDYRPAGKYAIHIWLKNKEEIKAVYNVEKDSFKIYKYKKEN